MHAHDGVVAVGDLRKRCHLVRAPGHHHLEPELLHAAHDLVLVHEPPRADATQKQQGEQFGPNAFTPWQKKILTQAGGVFQAMQMSNGGMSRPWMQRTWQVYVSVSDARCHGNGKHTQHVVGQQINSTSLRVKTGTGGGRAKEEASKLRHRAGRVGRRPRRPRPATAHRERLHLSGCIPCVYLSRSRRREVAAPSSRRARHLPAQQISPWRRCTTQLPLQDCSGIHRGSGQGRLA
jgi:hypothetical protein